MLLCSQKVHPRYRSGLCSSEKTLLLREPYTFCPSCAQTPRTNFLSAPLEEKCFDPAQHKYVLGASHIQGFQNRLRPKAFDARETLGEGLRLQLPGEYFVEEIAAVFDDVVENKKAINLGQKPDFLFGKGVNFVVFFQESQEAFFHHRLDVVSKDGAIAHIGDDPADEIKIHHAGADAEPVVIPAREEAVGGRDREITDVPIYEDGNFVHLVQSELLAILLKTIAVFQDDLPIGLVLHFPRWRIEYLAQVVDVGHPSFGGRRQGMAHRIAGLVEMSELHCQL